MVHRVKPHQKGWQGQHIGFLLVQKVESIACYFQRIPEKAVHEPVQVELFDTQDVDRQFYFIPQPLGALRSRRSEVKKLVMNAVTKHGR